MSKIILRKKHGKIRYQFIQERSTFPQKKKHFHLNELLGNLFKNYVDKIQNTKKKKKKCEKMFTNEILFIFDSRNS